MTTNKPKKALGQHFLKSEKALSSIINAANISERDTVLEIGPGKGVLTEKLLANSGQVIAVEKDDELYEFLQTKFSKEIESKKLILIHDDILSFEFEVYKLQPASYKLVANIPYNITGAIIEKFLTANCQPSLMVLLIQREVAQRIVAVGGKQSILSLSVQAYGKPRYVEMVKAGSFVPRPKVDSAIIAIEDISRNFLENMAKNNNLEAKLPSVEREFFELVKAGFSSKRKKLSSNLSKVYPKEEVLKAFKTLELDENTRAEDVDIHLWKGLLEELM